MQSLHLASGTLWQNKGCLDTHTPPPHAHMHTCSRTHTTNKKLYNKSKIDKIKRNKEIRVNAIKLIIVREQVKVLPSAKPIKKIHSVPPESCLSFFFFFKSYVHFAYCPAMKTPSKIFIPKSPIIQLVSIPLERN